MEKVLGKQIRSMFTNHFGESIVVNCERAKELDEAGRGIDLMLGFGAERFGKCVVVLQHSSAN